MIVDFLKYVAATLTALGVILSFFEKGRKFLVGTWHGVGHLFTRNSAHRVDLKITPDHGFCQWQEGSGDLGKEAMLVYCKLFLTNVAPSPAFQILDVYIKKPFTRGIIFPTARPHPTQAQLQGARLAHEFEARFTVSPPACHSKAVFTCDVVLTDQFGKKHTAKRVKFQPMGGPAWEMMQKQREHEKQTWEQIRLEQEQTRRHVDEITQLQQRVREKAAEERFKPPEPKKVSQ